MAAGTQCNCRSAIIRLGKYAMQRGLIWPEVLSGAKESWKANDYGVGLFALLLLHSLFCPGGVAERKWFPCLSFVAFTSKTFDRGGQGGRSLLRGGQQSADCWSLPLLSPVLLFLFRILSLSLSFSLALSLSLSRT